MIVAVGAVVVIGTIALLASGVGEVGLGLAALASLF